MNIGFRTGAIDIGQPVNWSAGLNYGLVSWWLAINQGPYFGSTRFLDLCNRNHGTLTNGPTWGGARGRPGGWGALSFDGSDDHVEVSSSDSLSSGFSIALWIRAGVASGVTDAKRQVLSHGGVNEYIACEWSDTNSSYSGAWYMNGGGSYPVAKWTSTLAADTWHHIGATWNATTLRVFVNGLEENSTANSTFGVISTPWLQLNGLGSGRKFACQMDDVVIYSRALSASEMLARYNASRTGYQNELNWRRRYTVFDVGGGAAPTVSRARFLPTNWAA